MPRFIDLTGRVFGRLTITRRDGYGPQKQTLWRCRCECGTETTVRAGNLAVGTTTSCGCLHREQLAARTRRHGMAGTRTHRIWAGMRKRCFDRNLAAYPNYGGRGITICARWDGFANFLADMGECPPGLSIERLDTNGHYEPANCIWGTPKQQANNKRNNRILAYRGEALTVSQWADRTGISARNIWRRVVQRGWPVERALTTPV